MKFQSKRTKESLVYQLTDSRIVAVYKTCDEAAVHINGNAGSIRTAISKGATYKGYYWSYNKPTNEKTR